MKYVTPACRTQIVRPLYSKPFSLRLAIDYAGDCRLILYYNRCAHEVRGRRTAAACRVNRDALSQLNTVFSMEYSTNHVTQWWDVDLDWEDLSHPVMQGFLDRNFIDVMNTTPFYVRKRNGEFQL